MKLTLDGAEIEAAAGSSLLAVVRAAGREVPALCAHDRIGAAGRCRTCVVEVQGKAQLVPSCCTPAEEGMVVKSASARVKAARRVITELAEAEMSPDKPRGRLDGRCGLATASQLAGAGRPGLPTGQRERGADARHPAIRIEFDKCVACGLCEKATHEVVMCDVLSVVGRGAGARVAVAYEQEMVAGGCVACGECASVCPTGAITEARGRRAPDVEVQHARSVCTQCSVGCNADVVHRDGDRVRVVGIAAPPAEGELCSRARFGMGEALASRLLSPLVRLRGHARRLAEDRDPRSAFREASWDEALDRIAARLLDLRARRGPDALAVLGSALGTNEDAYVLQRWARAALGTRHVDHVGRSRDALLVSALDRAHGIAASTATFAQLDEADAIVVCGGDPWVSHPVAGMRLLAAARHGAKLVVIDARASAAASMAEVHLHPAAGGEPLVLWGLVQALVSRGRGGPAGAAGLHVLKDSLTALDAMNAAELEGVPGSSIDAAAEILANAKRPLVLTADTAVPGIADGVVDLAALLAGPGEAPRLLCLWSEGNTQGALDMGLAPDRLPGQARPGDAQARRRLEGAWSASLDHHSGLDETAMFLAAREGALGALVVVGADPLDGAADALRRSLSLERVGFLVAVDSTLGATAALADVVLPASLPTEREGTVTSAERRVQWMQAVAQPPRRARREWRMIAELSARMGVTLPFAETADVTRAIAADVPAYASALPDALARSSHVWPLAQGARTLLPAPTPQALERPRVDRPLRFDPVASREAARALALARRSPTLAPLLPEPFVELHPADARFNGIAEGDRVRLVFAHGSVTARAHLRRRTAPGTVVPAPSLVEAAAHAAAADPVGGPSAWSVKVEKTLL